MIEPTLSFVPILKPQGFFKLAYWTWDRDPERTKPLLFCAHGLTRNGRDFDVLGDALSDNFRVVAVDFPGRGRSDWLPDPMLYQVPLYLNDVATLLAHLRVNELTWVGTSMGGIVGMLLAAMPGTPIRRLVVNDIGPELDPAGVERIRSYAGLAVEFPDYGSGRAQIIRNSTSFGPHTDAQWDLFVRHYLIQRDGRWVFNYDPRIGDAFRQPAPPINLWPFYESIRCPTLALRGRESDLFSAEVAAQMTKVGPKCELISFAGVGHAPTLMASEQIAPVREFVLR